MESSKRRRLFERGEPEHHVTPLDRLYLEVIAECGMLTTPQVMEMMQTSEKTAKEHLRSLYDNGLTERTARPILQGRTPTVHYLSKKAAKEWGVPFFLPPGYLEHDIEVRDMRVWLEWQKRKYGHLGVTCWNFGLPAKCGNALPDAFFNYVLGDNTLIGMVEIDRATMKSPARWQKKFHDYAGFFEEYGAKGGRVLIVVPDEKRREQICDILKGEMAKRTVPHYRFWITIRSSLLQREDLGVAVWRVPEQERLMPLVEAHLLTKS